MPPSLGIFDWVYPVVAITLASLGVPLLIWALWGDRARGRRRCPRCWYDMGGTPGLKCPECGRAASSEPALFRTRRRRRTAVFGALLCVLAVSVALVPSVRSGRIWSRLPLTAILAIEWCVGPETITRLTHERRLAFGRDPWDWQLEILVARELRDRVAYREVWPEGLPLFVVNPDNFYHNSTEEFSVEFERYQPAAAPVPGPSHQGFAYSPAAQIAGSETDRAIVAVVRQYSRGGVHVRGEPRTHRVVIPVRRVATVDAAITPVRDSAVDEAIRGTLDPRIVVYPDTGRAGVVLTQPTVDRDPREAPLAVGLVITIEHQGKVVATARALTRTVDVAGDVLPAAELSGDLAALLAGDFSAPEWRVRIKGDGEMSLRDFRATRFWAGELEFSAADVMR